MPAKMLKQIECPPECGFLVRSHDEKELIDIAKAHAKNIHDIKMSDGELKNIMKKVKNQERA
ncbi:MAG: DUF1059 domain-containing protein [Nitrospirae bacterium]|nr:DUF1059 domain-containing protein [Nitrospirota bacterium]